MIRTFVVSLVKSIIRHNIGSLAAIIAYFGFSSLLPVMALLMTAASIFVSRERVALSLQHVFQSYFPAIPADMGFATSAMQHLVLGGAHVTIIGIVGLVWGSVGGFVTLQQLMDKIYEVHHRRAFFMQYVIGFLMMSLLLALTLASTLMPWIASKLLFALKWVHGDIPWLVQMSGHVLFPLALLTTCYCCYRILPSRRLRLGPTIIASLVTTGLIYLSRSAFVIYTHHLGNYLRMYGAMSFVMLLTFWIYIACMILLFGAEVAVNLDNVWRSTSAESRSSHDEGTDRAHRRNPGRRGSRA